jgi:hypothetical protein
VQRFDPRGADQLVGATPEDPRRRRGHVSVDPGPVDPGDDVTGRLGQDAVQRLALGQRDLLGDITRDDGGERASVGNGLTDDESEGKRLTVSAQPDRSAVEVGLVRTHGLAGPLTRALRAGRHEHGEVSSDDVGLGVAEHRLGRPVERENRAVLADGDDPVGAVLDDQPRQYLP